MTGLTALDRRHGPAPENFVEHLQALAQTRPDEVWLIAAGESNGEPVERSLTYAAIDRRTRALAARLQQQWAPGERALIMLDNDEHYAVSLLACFYAGLIAVPVFPPESLRPQHLARLKGIATDCQAVCVLTSSVLLSMMDSAKERFLQAEAIAVDTVDWALAEGWHARLPADGDVAFLQYTSGSTSAPKGVMVTHGSLMANERAIRERMEIGAQDKFVSWAPLYHDMGLIGGLLQPLYSGVPLVLTSPRYFLERPVRWLQLISRHRATVSGGPDFSYRLCMERVTDAQLAGIDLSCWRLAYTGAEPVRADTGQAFCDRFAQAGLSARAVYACYGLAEATLFITGGRCGAGMVAHRFDNEKLAQGQAHCSEDHGSRHSQLVACGTAVPAHAVAIVEPRTLATMGAGQVGEIWAEGPSLCAGYWGRPDETAATFVEREGRRWLRTGDLGFLHQDQLYVTGRIKDLIIIRGHNVYPQDIERAIETEVEAVRKGRVAAFAVPGPDGEGIGIAAEVSRSLQKLVPPQALAEALAAAVSEAAGQGLSVVVLLNPGALPKTSSGKLQRQACRAGWQERTLDAYAIWEQGTVVQGQGAPQTNGEALSRTEQVLADLWKEVLPWPVARPMARETHFFTAGGNSLLAVQAALRVSAHWGIEFSQRDLFDHPRLGDCAAVVQARKPTPAAAAQRFSPVRLPAERRAQALPLSAAQSRQWFLWQLAPRSSAYHVAAAVQLQGFHLPAGALQTAADALSARHESLRTLFRAGLDGSPCQWIQQSLPIALQVADLRSIPAGEQSLQTSERTLQWKTEAFDLEKGPLWRLALVRLTDTSQIVVLVLHHIVSDAASMQLLLDELAAHCAAALGGSAALQVDEDALQYADYVASHRMWLEQGQGRRQLAWWCDQLGDVHPVLALQTDRPRQSQSHYLAARHHFALPAGLLAALRQRADAHGTSLFTVLLAGLQALAHRYTGAQDIRIGVPVAGRHRHGAQGIVGLLVNTLVLRNGVQADMALDRLLAKARDFTLSAQDHQDLPLDQLVEALKPERSAGQNPLFQWLFNHVFEDYRALERLPGATVQGHPLPEGEAQFEWVLESRERHDGQVALAIIYAAELFEAQTIERMAGHYVALLQALADRPEQLVGEVPLLGAAEQAQLAAWGDNRQGHGAPVPVHELFERQARLQPNAPALVFGEERLSYGQLNARANRLAHRLVRLGVRPETRVGILVERSTEMVVGLLGILKAGGAYVPLDPQYPPERLAYMVQDSGIALLLTQSHLGDSVSQAAGLSVLALDTLVLNDEPEHDPKVALHAENLAYVIYTSGSTGRPKGAAIRHGALHSCMAWMQQTYALNPSDTVLHKAPFGFDVSVWETFWPLTTGVRLVVANPGDHRDPERLVQLIRQHQITTLNFVPSMLQAFLAHEGIEHQTRLRYIICGGEAMPAATQQEALRRLQGASLQNLYGPTETTIHVTQWQCREDGRTQVPIGRPISATQALVLDGQLNPVPLGVAGELYLGGISLARGYLGRAGLTAERFIAGDGGQRLYRTGDLVRWNAQGQLEYLGRLDHQVKIRGLRIELGEIEAQLLGQPEVREAVVVEQGGRLVAYVALHEHGHKHGRAEEAGAQRIDATWLRERLGQALPDYMVPAVAVVLQGLPLNANGKVDRKVLPAAQFGAGEGYEAPQGEIEEALAAIWAEVLGLERVGRNDHFFDIGGHSLLLVRVHRLLQSRCQVSLPLVQLFQYPTVAALARRIHQGASAAPAETAQADHRALRQRAALIQRRQSAERVN